MCVRPKGVRYLWVLMRMETTFACFGLMNLVRAERARIQCLEGRAFIDGRFGGRFSTSWGSCKASGVDGFCLVSFVVVVKERRGVERFTRDACACGWMEIVDKMVDRKFFRRDAGYVCVGAHINQTERRVQSVSNGGDAGGHASPLTEVLHRDRRRADVTHSVSIAATVFERGSHKSQLKPSQTQPSL